MSFERSPENLVELEKLAVAIKTFLSERYARPANQTAAYVPWEFKPQDAEISEQDKHILRSGNFDINQLKVTSGPKNSPAYEFQVGQTVFYLAGRAAAEVESYLRKSAA
ncbi:MAG: hypothetical protein WC750_05120 [Patescibacteria group bacterium]|jgi:hypothetical protein